MDESHFAGQFPNYFGSLAVAMGYICVIMLICKRGWLQWLTNSFQAAGQMALTNYLMQSIILSLIFYGHGLGMIGYVSRTQQVLIVIAIWIFQLVLSPWWMKRFRFGPFEWLWRSLTYLKFQPVFRDNQ